MGYGKALQLKYTEELRKKKKKIENNIGKTLKTTQMIISNQMG